MAEFINIDGTLIDIEGVSATWMNDTLFLYRGNSAIGSRQAFCVIGGTNARRAYEWMKTTCIATFTNERTIYTANPIAHEQQNNTLKVD